MKKVTFLALAGGIVCGATNNVVLAKSNDNVDISGYIMLDSNTFDTTFLEDAYADDKYIEGSQTIAGIRKARVSFKSDINKNWRTKFQLDFSGDNAEVKDAYLRYEGLNWANITIGKQKEAFGLEKLTSSRNLMMMERSVATQALAPGRSLGVSVAGELSKSVTWNVGVYQLDADDNATDNQKNSAITGRVTWVPWQSNNSLLHVGVAFSERNVNVGDGSGSEFRINEQMEVSFSDSLIEGETLQADNVSMQGLELLWQKDKFTTSAEWLQATVTDTSDDQYTYQGGYIQASYQLSGGSRKYKKSVLGAVTNSGWEVTSRYSHFDLVEEDIQSNIFSAGVNYTANKKLKFMADYINADHTIQGISLDNGNAVSIRAQYSF